MKNTYRVLAVIFVVLFFFNVCGCSYDIDNDISNYSQILSDFKITINGVLSESFENDFNNGKFISPDTDFKYEWGNMLIDAKDGLDNPTASSFGYILKDINNDNINELFLIREDYTILAIFTLNNSKPHLLGAFWSRYTCIMLDNDNLYILSSNGADDFEYTIYRLAPNNELSIVKQFGMKESYYEKINNEIISISKIQFNNIIASYPYKSGINWSNNKFYDLDTIKLSDDSSMINS